MAERFRSLDLMHVLRGAVPELETAAGVDIRSSKCPSLQTVVVLSDTETRYFIEKMQILWLTQLDPTTSGTLRLKDAIDSGTPSFVYKVHNLQRRIQFDEPANIQFTSVIHSNQLTANRIQTFVDQGTTGNPKGATLSHHNIVNNAFMTGYRVGFHEQVFLHSSVDDINTELFHELLCLLGSSDCATGATVSLLRVRGGRVDWRRFRSIVCDAKCGVQCHRNRSIHS